jgi:hypothetical protein
VPQPRKVGLDSSVVLRWVLQEQRWQVVERLIHSIQVDLILPGPVVSEVISLANVEGNVSTSDQIRLSLTAAGMLVEPPTTDDLQVAGEMLIMSRAHVEMKNGIERTLSLRDSLILAGVARLDCPVVTSDRYRTWLADQGLLPVQVNQL